MNLKTLSIALLFPILANAQTSLTDTLVLDELVVVGFSQQKKVNLTGSVSQVNMEQVLGDRALMSTGAALQGMIPGLSISGASTPGQNKNFNIRGSLSINGGSPLILIDNMEGDLSSLNPEDIASVSVLKDAASAAIYGARAAGGVILITTKHPDRKQSFKLDYSFNLGFERSLASPHQASLSDYISAYQEAGFSTQYWAGEGSIERWQELLGLYAAGRLEGVYPNGIFQDEDGKVYFLKEGDVHGNALERGFLNSHNICTSGASENIRYRISASYNYENGPMLSSKDAFSRKSINTYISSDITKWFTQELNFYYTDIHKSDIVSTFRDPYSIRLISWYPEGYMPKEISGEEEDLLIDSPRNACLYQPASSSLSSSPRLLLKSIFKATQNWSLILEYSHQQKNSSFRSYTGQMTICDAQLAPRTLPAAGQDNYIYNLSTDRYSAINIYSDYSFKAGGHSFAAILGFNQEEDSYSYVNNSVLGQSVITVPSLQGGTGKRTSQEGLSEYSVRGLFGRLSYNYLGRYLIEVNARYDGSSKFPHDSRFGIFPSVSAGWRLSEEKFLEWTKPILNNLKLRASYGSIGNQNIAPYGYVASMNINDSSVWLDKASLVSVISTPGLIRGNYTWETVSTLDLGVDLNAFRDQFSLVFDWYRRTTTGMLSDGVELPSVVGAAAPLQNVADMQTEGWELALNWNDRIGDFEYHLGFNIYDHQSRITKFNNLSKNLKYNYVGKTLGEIWGYQTDGYYSIDDFDLEKAKSGIWVLNEGVPAINGVSVKPGDVKFKNLDDNPVIDAGSNTLDDPGDRKVIGNSTARYEYGAQLGFSWKGIGLNVILQGVGKRDVVLPSSALFPFADNDKSQYSFGAVYSNQTDYWRALSYDPESPDYMVAANPDAYLPRIYSQMENGPSNMRTSDKYLQDASYLRVKNITLSYSFPQRLLNKSQLVKALRIYASVENLCTFSSLPAGYDPESLRWTYPFYRTCSFGAQMTF